MSCPDAPAAVIVNSAIAASKTKAWATRSVFKRIVPPYFPFYLVCISQETLARSRCPVGPAWRLPWLLSGRRAALFACDVVSQTAKRRTTPLLQDAQERSEEHTSELQSHLNLLCRLLLEKKKKTIL